jgi:hypothetical protein
VTPQRASRKVTRNRERETKKERELISSLNQHQRQPKKNCAIDGQKRAREHIISQVTKAGKHADGTHCSAGKTGAHTLPDMGLMVRSDGSRNSSSMIWRPIRSARACNAGLRERERERERGGGKKKKKKTKKTKKSNKRQRSGRATHHEVIADHLDL